MKKIKRRGSYLSMENLDPAADEQSQGSDTEQSMSPEETPMEEPEQSTDNVTLHPSFILQQAFSRVKAVGSSTAMIGIRN